MERKEAAGGGRGNENVMHTLHWRYILCADPFIRGQAMQLLV